MAKGDSGRAQNQINNQGTTSQDSLNSVMNTIYGQNLGFQNNYNTGVNTDLSSYNNIMGQYQNLINGLNGGGGEFASLGGGGGGGMGGGAGNEYGLYSQLANNGAGYGWDPTFYGALQNAISGFGDFAKTGGFSPQDIQDIRARAISPTRAVYANAQANLNQNKALQQFSPNYAAATAKMARDLGYGISDANVDANASIAQLVQQGKLAGMQGLTSAGVAGQGQDTAINQLNLQGKLAGLQGMTGIDQFNASAGAAGRNATINAILGSLGGMTNLYGATPGLANTFGNQLLNSSNQLLTGQQLQNQLSLGLTGNQIQKSGIPGDFGQAMSNVGSVAKVVGQVAAAVGTGGASLMMPGGGLYGPGGVFGGGGNSSPPTDFPTWAYGAPMSPTISGGGFG